MREHRFRADAVRAGFHVAVVICAFSLLGACTRSLVIPRPRGEGTHPAIELQRVTVGEAPMHALVARFPGEAVVDHALQLDGGDFLLSVSEAAPSQVLRVSPDGQSRWARRGRACAALERDAALFVVGAMDGDAPSPRPLVRSISQLALVDGSDVWRRELPDVGAADDVTLVAGQDVLVVVSGNGLAAFRLDGTMTWTRRDDPAGFDRARAVVFDDVLVVVSQTRPSERDRHSSPCLVRAIKLADGETRAEARLGLDGAGCGTRDIAASASADRSIVVRVDALRDTGEGSSASSNAQRLALVLDPTTLEVRASVPLASPSETPEADAISMLGPGDVAFLDRYAQAPEALTLHVVDTVAEPARARAMHWLVPSRMTVGSHALDSYVQVMHVERTERGLHVAAQFVGELRAERGGRVTSQARAIESCEAAGFIECLVGNETTLVAPRAGLFGLLPSSR